MKDIPLGVHDDISNADYHAGPGISKSGLDLVHRSALHYWARYIDPEREPQEPTKALRMGSAIHGLVLEPDRFGEDFAVAPVCDRRTKIGKAAYADFLLDAEGKTVLSADEHELAKRIAESVHAHPTAAYLLSEGAPELSAYWRDEKTGELCRCRPDWSRPDGILVDLKTTEDAGYHGFRRSAWKWRYHVQAAFYLDGWTAAGNRQAEVFAFVAVEKSPPFAVAVYYASEDMVRLGREEYRADLDHFSACHKADQWPGYPTNLQQLDPPGWAMKE